MTPEVWAAVRDCAVAEQVAVTDGFQVGNCAQVVSAGTAASSPLAVGAKRVPDAANMERTSKLPLGPSGQDSLCSALVYHQEQHHYSQQRELHDKSVERKGQEMGLKCQGKVVINALL